MLKMKKVLATLLSLSLVAALAACGGANSSSQATPDEAPDEASAAETAGVDDGDAGEDEAPAPSGDGGEIRVTWWGAQARHNSTIEALDAYAAANGVTFSYEYASWDSYFENLATQAVANDLPDIIQMSMDNIIKYTENGQLIDMTPYIDNGTIDITNVDPANIDAGTVDGKFTGYISGVNSICVVYNPEVFDDAGVDYPSDDWTWSEYLATAQAIYDATGVQTEIPFLQEGRWLAEHVVRCYGYDYYGDSGVPWGEDEATINGLTNAFQDIRDMVEAGVFVDPEVQTAWSANEDFYMVQGKSAMNWGLTNAYATACEIIGKELGIVMIPQQDDATRNGSYLNANMYWSISSDCEDPQAAAEVLNYLVNSPEAAEYIATDRGISLNSEIRDMLSSSADAYNANSFAYISKVADAGVATNNPDPVEGAEAIMAMRTIYQALCYGELSPEDAVAQYIAEASSILR